MRNDERKATQLHTVGGRPADGPGSHVVFDLSGTARANVEDISLILTARLRSAPTDEVWVHSMPSRTAHILRLLRLEHLFRLMPENHGEAN